MSKNEINYNEVVACGNKLYYDINPNSVTDVPSLFYERLESEWRKWKQDEGGMSFYEYCKRKNDRQNDDKN